MSESIAIQRDIIRRMNTAPMPPMLPGPGPGAPCCRDPWTGKPLTYGEFFDIHAMTMMVIDEVEARTSTEKQEK